MKNPKKAIITGATGFLGLHVVAQCLKSGLDVYAGVRKASLPLNNLISGQSVIELDLLKSESIEALIAKVKPDLIINCAAYGVNPSCNDAALLLSTNLNAVLNLLDIAAKYKVSRFIQLGSCFEYGDKTGPIKESEALVPVTPYGVSKAAASLLLLERARTVEVEIAILRAFGMWGPYEAAYRLVPQILQACKNNKALSLTGCIQRRDYSYVKDMARMIRDIALLNHFPNHQVINLASGKSTSLKDFVLAIASLFGKTHLMHFDDLPYRENEMWDLQADVTKLKEILGEIPYTSLNEGIEEMLMKELSSE